MQDPFASSPHIGPDAFRIFLSQAGH
jgi:hypothetical protein